MSLGAVGIPIVGLPSWELMRSIIGLKSPAGFAYFTVGEYRRPKPIDTARNEIVEMFLADERLEWLMFVDSDATLHPLTLNRLLSWRMPIVSALCFTRRIPVVPTVFGDFVEGDKREIKMQAVMDWLAQHPQLLTRGASLLKTDYDGALIESSFVGMHATVIQRRVFEQMKPPYFLLNQEKQNGEDVYFCEKASRFGLKSYVDMSVVAGHQAMQEISALNFQAWVLWAQQQKAFNDI